MSASFLTEGMNTIRVCVTDLAGKTGSATTSVEKDTTAPVVVIDTLSDSLLGPADSGTQVTWHADEPTIYSVRVYGVGISDPGCDAGTEVNGGTYVNAPTPHVTAVSAGSLLETLDAIRICAVDAAGNESYGTAYAVKDLTAPAIAIDAVSDDALGPSDDGTNVTWHADTDGPYGVRVGGTDCATATVVASGDYDTAPRRQTTIVNADDLAEGANAVRVCLADVFGNQGETTTSVAKDTTPPAVVIDDVSDTLLGPADAATNVTWHASGNGPYSVRVGGSDCASGHVVAGGSYSGAPVPQVTQVHADDLAEGTNTIRVCVADSEGNEGENSATVVKDTSQSTTLTFGPEADARVEDESVDQLRYVDNAVRRGRQRPRQAQLPAVPAHRCRGHRRGGKAAPVGDKRNGRRAPRVRDRLVGGRECTHLEQPPSSHQRADRRQAGRALGGLGRVRRHPARQRERAKSFVLIGTSSDSLGVSSREASTGSQRPQLVVTAVTRGSDLEPPTAPTGLTATAPDSTHVDLDWTASTDNIGVTGYKIYRDGSLLTTVGEETTSYTDPTVFASTFYQYVVRALDAVGNVSDPSDAAEVTTPEPSPDRPSWPRGTWPAIRPPALSTTALARPLPATRSTRRTWS